MHYNRNGRRWPIRLHPDPLIRVRFVRSSLNIEKRGVNDIASFPVQPPSLTMNDQVRETYPHTGICVGSFPSSNSDHTQNDLRVMASFVHKQHQPHSQATSHKCHIPPKIHLARLWSRIYITEITYLEYAPLSCGPRFF